MFRRIVALAVAQAFLITNIGIGSAWAAPTDNKRFFEGRMRTAQATSAQAFRPQSTAAAALGLQQASIPQGAELEQLVREAAQVMPPTELQSVRIPHQHGKSIESYDGTTPKFILHLQDLHTQAEAQRNNASIIEHMIEDCGLALVCVEGAAGLVDTSLVGNYPDAAVRQAVADTFMEGGEITGEEYLAMTQHPDMLIWGVEEPELYFRNGLLYLANLRIGEEAQPTLVELERALDKLAEAVYSPELKELSDTRRSFEAKTLPFGGYTEFLMQKANEHGVATPQIAPNLNRLSEAMQLEAQMDSAKADQEARTLLQGLTGLFSTKGNQASLQKLLGLSVSYREGTKTALEFYEELFSIYKENAGAVDVSVAGVEKLIEYLKVSESIETSQLFSEMNALYSATQEALFQTGDQRTVAQLTSARKDLKELYSLGFSSRDWAGYQAAPERFRTANFQQEIERLSAANNINVMVNWPRAVARIDRTLPALEAFYTVAQNRDTAMAEKTLAKMQELGVDRAILIAGGFHTRGMMDLLKERGISYKVAAPNAVSEMDKERYHQMLAGSRPEVADLIKRTLKNATQDADSYRLMSMANQALGQGTGELLARLQAASVAERPAFVFEGVGLSQEQSEQLYGQIFNEELWDALNDYFSQSGAANQQRISVALAAAAVGAMQTLGQDIDQVATLLTREIKGLSVELRGDTVSLSMVLPQDDAQAIQQSVGYVLQNGSLVQTELLSLAQTAEPDAVYVAGKKQTGGTGGSIDSDGPGQGGRPVEALVHRLVRSTDEDDSVNLANTIADALRTEVQDGRSVQEVGQEIEAALNSDEVREALGLPDGTQVVNAGACVNVAAHFAGQQSGSQLGRDEYAVLAALASLMDRAPATDGEPNYAAEYFELDGVPQVAYSLEHFRIALSMAPGSATAVQPFTMTGDELSSNTDQLQNKILVPGTTLLLRLPVQGQPGVYHMVSAYVNTDRTLRMNGLAGLRRSDSDFLNDDIPFNANLLALLMNGEGVAPVMALTTADRSQADLSDRAIDEQDLRTAKASCGVWVMVGGEVDFSELAAVGAARVRHRGYDSIGLTVVMLGDVYQRKYAGQQSIDDAIAGLESDPLITSLVQKFDMSEQDLNEAVQLFMGHTRWTTVPPTSIPNAHAHTVVSDKIQTPEFDPAEEGFGTSGQFNGDALNFRNVDQFLEVMAQLLGRPQYSRPHNVTTDNWTITALADYYKVPGTRVISPRQIQSIPDDAIDWGRVIEFLREATEEAEHIMRAAAPEIYEEFLNKLTARQIVDAEAHVLKTVVAELVPLFHELNKRINPDKDMVIASMRTRQSLRGEMAVVLVDIGAFSRTYGQAVGWVRGPKPLIVGLADPNDPYVGHMFSSEPGALAPYTPRTLNLRPGDIMLLERVQEGGSVENRAALFVADTEGLLERVDFWNDPERRIVVLDPGSYERALGPYDTFTRREIHQQPKALRNTLVTNLPLERAEWFREKGQFADAVIEERELGDLEGIFATAFSYESQEAQDARDLFDAVQSREKGAKGYKVGTSERPNGETYDDIVEIVRLLQLAAPYYASSDRAQVIRDRAAGIPTPMPGLDVALSADELERLGDAAPASRRRPLTDEEILEFDDTVELFATGTSAYAAESGGDALETMGGFEKANVNFGPQFTSTIKRKLIALRGDQGEQIYTSDSLPDDLDKLAEILKGIREEVLAARASGDTSRYQALRMRYMGLYYEKPRLGIAISQSGNSKDTNDGVILAAAMGVRFLGIINKPGESPLADIIRRSNGIGIFQLFAGEEIGVASTKAYTAQVAALNVLANYIGQVRGRVAPEQALAHLQDMTELPNAVERMLADSRLMEQLKALALDFRKANGIFAVGRGLTFPTSKEANLKLKELAGTDTQFDHFQHFKHGPISLMRSGSRLLVIGTDEAETAELTVNLQEAVSRDTVAVVICYEDATWPNDLIVDAEGNTDESRIIRIPRVSSDAGYPDILQTILAIIPVQILALETTLAINEVSTELSTLTNTLFQSYITGASDAQLVANLTELTDRHRAFHRAGDYGAGLKDNARAPQLEDLLMEALVEGEDAAEFRNENVEIVLREFSDEKLSLALFFNTLYRRGRNLLTGEEIVELESLLFADSIPEDANEFVQGLYTDLARLRQRIQARAQGDPNLESTQNAARIGDMFDRWSTFKGLAQEMFRDPDKPANLAKEVTVQWMYPSVQDAVRALGLPDETVDGLIRGGVLHLGVDGVVGDANVIHFVAAAQGLESREVYNRALSHEVRQSLLRAGAGANLLAVQMRADEGLPTRFGRTKALFEQLYAGMWDEGEAPALDDVTFAEEYVTTYYALKAVANRTREEQRIFEELYDLNADGVDADLETFAGTLTVDGFQGAETLHTMLDTHGTPQEDLGYVVALAEENIESWMSRTDASSRPILSSTVEVPEIAEARAVAAAPMLAYGLLAPYADNLTAEQVQRAVIEVVRRVEGYDVAAATQVVNETVARLTAQATAPGGYAITPAAPMTSPAQAVEWASGMMYATWEAEDALAERAPDEKIHVRNQYDVDLIVDTYATPEVQKQLRLMLQTIASENSLRGRVTSNVTFVSHTGASEAIADTLNQLAAQIVGTVETTGRTVRTVQIADMNAPITALPGAYLMQLNRHQGPQESIARVMEEISLARLMGQVSDEDLANGNYPAELLTVLARAMGVSVDEVSHAIQADGMGNIVVRVLFQGMNFTPTDMGQFQQDIAAAAIIDRMV
ncbi:MAG: SIS domain-containing protein [Candidatus Omnitrophica bacterium]|nr:SIS domain-containing protein [Candidatus Omnitrophota bacterium]